MLGVDVSPTYQPSIDWRKAHAAGVDFAILKATEGLSWPASLEWLRAQLPAARAAGVLVGSYHFARPHRGDAAAQARHFLGALGQLLHDLDIIPWLDLETNDGKLHPVELASWVQTWCGTVEHELPRGRRCGGYLNLSTLRTLGGRMVGGRPLWLAEPGAHPSIDAPVWQSGWYGSLPGIGSRNVDVDRSGSHWASVLMHPPAVPAPRKPVETHPTTKGAPVLDLSRASTDRLVTGPGVRPLQALLTVAGDYRGRIDGEGGPVTRAALLGFQRRAGITVDAIAGPVTWAALETVR